MGRELAASFTTKGTRESLSLQCRRGVRMSRWGLGGKRLFKEKRYRNKGRTSDGNLFKK